MICAIIRQGLSELSRGKSRNATTTCYLRLFSLLEHKFRKPLELAMHPIHFFDFLFVTRLGV